MDKSRIKVLDGFRAIAVLGVLWAHIWMFFGNPGFNVFHINIAQLVSFFGTGVDLFFVISGFCMYLMHQNNSKREISLQWCLGYLSKRWLRIAPAFYFAILFYGLEAARFNVQDIEWFYSLKNAFFIKNFFWEPSIFAPHFWSLSVEWQFYLLLPLILIVVARFSFIRGALLFISISLVYKFYIASTLNAEDFNYANYTLLSRLTEFLMGIIIANAYVNQNHWKIINGWRGLALGIIVAFLGRILMSANFHYRTDLIGVAGKTFDVGLLSLGYAMVILNSLYYRSVFSKILESNVMNKIGRYSYSMYLWHWTIASNLFLVFANLHLDSSLSVNLTFVVSALLLFPISMISYKIFEAPYFQRRRNLLIDNNKSIASSK